MANVKTKKRAGKPWTEAEDLNLITSFDSGFGLGQLAKICNRTKGAVRARLSKYGRKP